jgi:integrase
VAVVVTLFNRAVDEELLDRNPFRGLARRTKGRAEQAPPSDVEMSSLLIACAALGEYAPQMRALVTFAAYSGMRPGELFALEWQDVDFDANRVEVRRRVYKGRLDLPKSNQERTIALTPLARDALLSLEPHANGWVFRTKHRKRFSQPTLAGCWGKVTARAGLDFDFYLATKHYAVHYLYVKLDLPVRVIAAQMGWSLKSVEKLIQTYGHGELGALDEVERAFASVIPLRRVVSDAPADARAAVAAP